MSEPMDNPLVSVVIATYNAGDDLRAAAQSVLRQTYQNIEVLLVDDGSTDGSVDRLIEQVSDPRLRVIRQANTGRAAALNRALQEIQGQFYATQDADDESYPQRIERQLRCLQDEPDLAAAFCGYDLILGHERVAPMFIGRDRAWCRRRIENLQMPCLDPTAMYRVAHVTDVWYEPSLRIGAAYDYVLRIGERHPMVVMGECLYSYRVDSAGVTRGDPWKRQQYVRQVRQRARVRRGMMHDPVGTAFEPQDPPQRWRNRDRDNNLQARFVESVVSLKSSGRLKEAVQTAARCASLHPLDPQYYRAFAYALAPKTLIQMYRRRNGV
jgi:glycosyltransferase involved in cell wall biosynthesis